MNELELCKKIRLSQGALAVYEGMNISNETYKERKVLHETNRREFYRLILQEADAKEQFLWYYIKFACETYEKYMEQGIDEKIFWDTFYDITIWSDHCYKEHGVYGIPVHEWFGGFFDMKIFRLGRLEFEYYDEFIHVHIPAGEPLDWKACEKSFEMAYQWFGREKDYVCHSWLLSPDLKNILSEDSNIIQFQNHFDVKQTDYEERQAEERIFGHVLQSAEAYPEQTSLQKKAKAYLLAGRSFANGFGILKK